MRLVDQISAAGSQPVPAVAFRHVHCFSLLLQEESIMGPSHRQTRLLPKQDVLLSLA